MKKTGVLFLGVISGILLAFGFLWLGSVGSTQAHSGLPQTAPTVTVPFVVDGPPISISGDESTPPAITGGSPGVNALATPIPGESLVYFLPTDNDATATVIYLLNTDTAAHIVALRGYSYNGVLVYSLSINVPATSLLRLSSDSIAAAPPPSWATPAPIITNFTDFTYFASLSLPKGVKAEGYVLFNPGTGVVDPRLDQGAIPLRFSSDPATVFIPAAQNP